MLQLDILYPISIPYGATRLASIVISLIVMLCLWAPVYYPTGTGLIWFTAVGSLISSLVYLLLYTLHLPETGVFQKIPWIFIEFWFTAFWTLFYFMSFIASAVISSNYSNTSPKNIHVGYGASAFFCCANLLLYGFLAFLLFRHWKFGTTTTRQATVTTSSTTTSVRY